MMKGKLVIISDLHYGFDYRGNPRREAFSKLVEDVSKLKADGLILLGDVFHSKFLRGEDIHNVISGLVEMCKGERLLVIGNHDLEALGENKRLVVRFLSRYFTLITEPKNLSVVGYNILFIPYIGQNPPSLLNYVSSRYDLVVGHYFIQEYISFPSTEAYPIDSLTDLAPIVIMGHSHTYRYIEGRNMLAFTGCTIPVSFSDCFELGRWYEINKSNLEVKHTHGVQFIDLRKQQVTEVLSHICPECLLLVRAYDNNQLIEKLKRDYKVISLQIFPYVNVSDLKRKVLDPSRQDVSSKTIEEAFTIYIKKAQVSSDLEQLVLTKGLEYIHTARTDQKTGDN